MKRLARIFATAFAVLSFSAFSAENIVISFDAANPPFMYEQNGKAAGLYPAIIEAAFKHMQVGVTLKAKPWARVIRELDMGITGVGGIFRTAERERKYDYSEPVFAEKLLVYFNKSRPVVFNKVDDLRNLHVGIVRGWSYGERFDLARKANHFTVEETPADEQNFRKLELARVDAVVAIAESGTSLMTKLKNISVAPTPLAQNPTFLAFAKSAQKKAVLSQFNQTIKEMKASGEFERIVAAETGQ